MKTRRIDIYSTDIFRFKPDYLRYKMRGGYSYDSLPFEKTCIAFHWLGFGIQVQIYRENEATIARAWETIR